MIHAEPTRFGAGITLWGDYNDLRSIYDTVGKVVDAAPSNIGDFIVALNYDIRHAYEGQREEKAFGHDELDQVRYRGVQILWPHILLQAGLVRSFFAFVPTTREDQANMFRLEFALEQALTSFDATVGAVCAEWLALSHNLSEGFLTQFIDEVSFKYVCNGSPGKARFRRLPSVLRSLSASSPEYRAFEVEIKKIAKEKGCEPSDLQGEPEWPDFKW